jgi:hypothetical protein
MHGNEEESRKLGHSSRYRLLQAQSEFIAMKSHGEMGMRNENTCNERFVQNNKNFF